MTADEFRRAGEFLFGAEHWRRAVASLFDSEYRWIQRWGSGSADNPVPDDIAAVLAQLCEMKRQRQAARLARQQRRA